MIIPHLLNIFRVCMPGWGWGASVEQSRYPRQVDLTFNATSDCNCSSRYFLETNVGPQGQDTCEGDSGQTEISLFSLVDFQNAKRVTLLSMVYWSTYIK